MEEKSKTKSKQYRKLKCFSLKYYLEISSLISLDCEYKGV